MLKNSIQIVRDVKSPLSIGVVTFTSPPSAVVEALRISNQPLTHAEANSENTVQ
jgi:hypothetical protein